MLSNDDYEKNELYILSFFSYVTEAQEFTEYQDEQTVGVNEVKAHAGIRLLVKGKDDLRISFN
jgi:hypothetical protein